jgi:hypothetical protein
LAGKLRFSPVDLSSGCPSVLTTRQLASSRARDPREGAGRNHNAFPSLGSIHCPIYNILMATRVDHIQCRGALLKREMKARRLECLTASCQNEKINGSYWYIYIYTHIYIHIHISYMCIYIVYICIYIYRYIDR